VAGGGKDAVQTGTVADTDSGVLSRTGHTSAVTAPVTATPVFGSIRPVNHRPKFGVATSRYERETPLGTAFIFVSRWPVGGAERIQEVFAVVGKPGTHVQADGHAIGYQASVMLQCGIDPRVVAKTLQGIGGGDSVGFGAGRVRSLPDAVGQVLLEEIERLEGCGGAAPAVGAGAMEEPRPAPAALRDLCPVCGQATWVNESGCWHCMDPGCGASRC
jgi:ribonucleoside-diphosphate reductase alpha chain